MAERFELAGSRSVSTRYGRALVHSSKSGRFLVLQRHGGRLNLPPHRINYRANIAALKKLGVEYVIATSAVGTMDDNFGVGDVGLVDQFIDFTKSRVQTFFDDRAVHTDMTTPYSRRLAQVAEAAARSIGLRLHTGLVYAAAEGPRFETAAEIKMFRMMGGSIVGMTGVPEVVLARELGMEYASIAIATNRAAGGQDSVTHEEVLEVMNTAGPKVVRLVKEMVNQLSPTARGRGGS